MALPKFPFAQAHINSAIEELQTASDYLENGQTEMALKWVNQSQEQLFFADDELKKLEVKTKKERDK